MIALLVCLAIIVVGVVATLGARSFDAGRDERERAAELAELERTGLVASVDSSGWSLRGTKDGVELSIEGRKERPLPGKLEGSDGDMTGTLLTLSSPGLDFIVCRKEYTDAIVGALATAPRRPTGDAPFDAVFDVLATDPGPDGTFFVSAPVRRAFTRTGLQWMRRKEGRVEVLLARLDKNQMSAVAAIGVALARSDATAPIDVPGGETPPRAVSVAFPLLVSFGSLLAIGPMGTMLFALFPPVQWLFSDLVCPDGYSVVATSSNLGASTYYGAVCRHGASTVQLSTVFWFACAMLTVTLVACAGLVLAARRWLRIARTRAS